MCAFLDISGLRELFIVVTCVLLLPCGGMSAPYKPPEKPIWVDPCGGHTSVSVEQGDSSQASDQTLLEGIIITAKNALSYASSLSHQYVKNKFNSDLNSHHDTWKHERYHWLPNIPKGLGEKTPDHHLSALAEKRLDWYLVESYRYLQTVAVGLEQIHQDMVRFNEEFSPEFLNMQYKLKQVLCEVHIAISEKMPELKIDDVDRSVMSPDLRKANSDSSFRWIRDWLIYREFMNCLEYVIEVCEFFKSV
ncbi:uncharacterized protein LOC106670563 isoform X2 [Cimex lectularius]|uniref:Uncharacterized protein n=1 Tax=Cimex lectularius TaxID=79782 RepID=A0A8I6S3K9_CIMLE|nr:uncharacterized protein LOC106670563 isoform X2 [Cimex lectularius]